AGALVCFGMLSLYSASIARNDSSLLIRQGIFFGVSVVAMMILSCINWRVFRRDSFIILFLYGVALLLLIGIFVFAPEIRGVKTWYRVGGVSIDPIESMKIILLILLAKFFSLRHREMYRFSHILLSGMYAIVPAILIFFQPNFGSASILVLLWLIILFVAGIPMRYVAILACIGLILSSSAWVFLLKEYQKNRIISFMHPQLDPLGIGWSQLQSKIAIGNGGLWGAGIGSGIQTQYGFLSEPQTDFIFSAIGEEFGYIGLVILFLLFGILLWRVLLVAMQAEHNFVRFFAVGFASLILVEVTINVGMNIGLMPIVGLPLPFVSYGGSSLFMLFVGLGILQSIKANSISS
ncbi:MAG: rod shape-determining protein RodA, partial [Candidatus Vogelbacteria bacterium]|nr:rod shape-determining protein RodA [Candidatus Vogelbacteria bacterium]